MAVAARPILGVDRPDLTAQVLQMKTTDSPQAVVWTHGVMECQARAKRLVVALQDTAQLNGQVGK